MEHRTVIAVGYVLHVWIPNLVIILERGRFRMIIERRNSMNKWRIAVLLWLGSSLAFFSDTMTGQQASEVTSLLQPNRQTKFSALLDGGLRRWDKSYLVTYGLSGTPDASPSKPSVIAYDRTGNIFR